MTTETQNRATTFAHLQKTANYEIGDSQMFWAKFFEIFSLDITTRVKFEYRITKQDGTKGRIDGFWKGVLLIEQKSRGEDLQKAYQQAHSYLGGLADDELPDYILVCDFQNFHLYNRKRDNDCHKFTLAELPQNLHLFNFMTDKKFQPPESENIKITRDAAAQMTQLLDAFKQIGYPAHSIDTYLVRLLFCMFAEDTGIFPKNSFHGLLASTAETGEDLGSILSTLFERLDTPPHDRLKIADKFSQFEYINGNLFSQKLPTAVFTTKTRRLLLESCKHDWGKITPSIFGSLFQAALSADARREMGAHYTEETKILQLINPLFMDDLRAEFATARLAPKTLAAFHEKLARLTFLDPACGTGNFLIIAYRELRRLELDVIEEKFKGDRQMLLDATALSKINVDQFFGIEIDELATEISKMGMWLCDHQCNLELSGRFGVYQPRIPLKVSAQITNTNALTAAWEPTDFILGNPPFVGYSMMTKQQKADLTAVLVDTGQNPIKNGGKVDYVTGWYYKAAQMMSQNAARAAFVSTNSITQGEQVAIIWQPLLADYKMQINFAYRTFKWSNEAKNQAAVYCVIVGFSRAEKAKISKVDKKIFDGENVIIAENINGYLVNAPNIFIESRKTPICDVPQMTTGNRPADGGHLIIENADLSEFLAKEPSAKKYIKQFVGGEEFINGKQRWCLWLVDCPQSELAKMPLVLERVKKCREDRLKGAADRQKLADTPYLMREQKNPESFIIIPATSSENRKYIPMGFLDGEYIPSNSAVIIPNANLYHFGILTSSIHMAWVRAVCGRLKSDYRYSKDIVYNNYPWPKASERQQEEIGRLAAEVLAVRQTEQAADAGLTLGIMYNANTMPSALAKAHRKLDRAVARAYGGGVVSEGDRVAELVGLYLELIEKEKI